MVSLLLSLVMWPFKRSENALQSPRLRDLLERMDEVEDKQRALERRFVRMQGEFSAYERWRTEFEDEEEEDDFDELVAERKAQRG